MQLSSAQKAAVESRAQNLLILAGPGTGKTRVLTSRMADFLQNRGTKPERILAVTFSRKATQEMEERLEAMQPGLCSRLEVSTLHAFCQNLVSRHGFRLGIGKQVRLISESEARLLLRQVSAKLPLAPFMKSAQLDSLYRELFDFFSCAKDEGIWPEAILQYASTLPSSTDDERKIQEEWLALGDLYNAFQSYCFERGLIDFGDSLLCAIRILEDHPVARDEVQSAYDLILVDEFQDTNYSQVRLLRAMAGEKTAVTVVGDDDQAIYRFRGASFSAFRFFEEMFAPIEVVALSETYRLSPAIAEVSGQLIAANGERRFRPDKKIQSLSNAQAPAQILEFESYEDEAAWVADQIAERLSKGQSPSQIAVLSRAHSHTELFLKAAAQRKIPVDAIKAKNISDSLIVHDVLALLRLIVRPNDSVAFLRLLDSPLVGLTDADIFLLIKSARGNEPLLADLARLETMPLSEGSRERLQNFQKFFEKAVVEAARLSPSQILIRFLEDFGAISRLLDSDDESLRILAQLLSHFAQWEQGQVEKSLRALFPVIEGILLEGQSLSDDESEVQADPSRVAVLSIHASKGLEFETVFILSLVGRRFPSAFSKPVWPIPESLAKETAATKELHLDEERRLLYVAMTRAKNDLFLTSLRKKGTKPSVFLEEDLKSTPSRFLRRQQIPAFTKPFEAVTPRTPFVSTTRAPAVSGPMQLSYSQIEKYETCPLAYRFRYDLKIPVEPTASLILGQLVHQSIETFCKREGPKTLDNLHIIYEEKLKEADSLLMGEIERELGKVQLKHFFEVLGHKNPLAVEKKFDLSLGRHKLIGKIDRVDAGTSPTRAVIVDFKTGKVPSDENYADKSLQLSLYALAAKESLGLEVEALSLLYLTENQNLSTTRAPEDLAQTKEEVIAIAEKISERAFAPTPGRHCQWCEYERLCPAVKRGTLGRAAESVAT